MHTTSKYIFNGKKKHNIFNKSLVYNGHEQPPPQQNPRILMLLI